MTRPVVQLRVNEVTKERWEKASGGNLSAWARRVLTEEADRVLAESSDEAFQRRQRVEEITRAFPAGEVTTAALGASLHYSGKKSYKPDPR